MVSSAALNKPSKYEIVGSAACGCKRTSSDSCTEFRVKVQRLPRGSSYASKQCGQQFFGAAEE